jgi:hypothetical protein
LPDHVLDGAKACEIDDRDDLVGDVREAVAGAGEDLWRSLGLAGILAGEKLFDGAAAIGGFEIAWAAIAPFRWIVRTLFSSSKWVRSAASHSSRCNIRKWGFGIHLGSAGSKPDGPFSMA